MKTFIKKEKELKLGQKKKMRSPGDKGAPKKIRLYCSC